MQGEFIHKQETRNQVQYMKADYTYYDKDPETYDDWKVNELPNSKAKYLQAPGQYPSLNMSRMLT